MSERVLIVDDDINLLSGIRRQLFDKFDITTAEGGAAALHLIDEEAPFAVVLSDMRMPEMDGIELLGHFGRQSKDTVRMMLTGNADQQTAIDAINEGHIFRFLKKPCSQSTLCDAIQAGIEQYRLVVAEQELLSKTVAGTVKAFTEILSLLNPNAFAVASRARRLVRDVAKQLQVDRPWEVEMAAMLSQMGWVTVPNESHRDLPAPSRLSYDLVKSIPRLEGVANILASCGTGADVPPEECSGPQNEEPIGASVLKMVLAYDALIDSGVGSDGAIDQLHSKGFVRDPRLLDVLRSVVAEREEWDIEVVSPGKLAVGSVLAKDILTADGRILLRQGQEISEPIRQRLIDISKRTELAQSIHVLGQRKQDTGEVECVVPSSFESLNHVSPR